MKHKVRKTLIYLAFYAKYNSVVYPTDLQSQMFAILKENVDTIYVVGQLSLVPSVGRKMSIGQSAVTLCGLE